MLRVLRIPGVTARISAGFFYNLVGQSATERARPRETIATLISMQDAHLWVQDGSFLARLVAGNAPHEVTAPGVRYFATREAVLIAGSTTALYKVCHIRLTAGGAILIQTPYFSERKGIAGELRWKAAHGSAVTMAFERGWARATSHPVKLTHPRDGNAHFSQDGKVKTEIFRKTFPLDTGTGFVFQLEMWEPDANAFIAPDANLPTDRVHLPFVFVSEAPRTLGIVAEWLPRESFVSRIIGSPNGPRVENTQGGRGTIPAYLLSFPGDQYPGNLLRVSCGVTGAQTDGRLAVLRGAWDPDLLGEEETGCLAYMYPAGDHDEKVDKLGSMDFNPGVSAPTV